MKKNLFMVAAVALMAMISCNKEEINNVGEPQAPETPEVVEPSYYVEFTADLGADDATAAPAQQSAATRTTLDVKNKKTLWVAGDAISVNGKKFVIKELIDGGLSARFVNEGELGTDFKAPYKAQYPYTSNGTLSISALQTAFAGDFDANAVAAFAYSTDNVLKFKNATSLLKFQVPAACKKVTLSSDNALAGTLTITWPTTDDGTPTATASGKEVTISGDFKTGNDYYVAVLPGTKNDFSVKVDGYVVKSATSVTIDRSKIIKMSLPYNIYLHANTTRYNWTSDNARFATWTWGTGVTDSWFNLVAEGHDGVYRLEVPAGYTNLIFCRMNGSNTTNDWANRWNQTVNITIPTDVNNHFYIYSENEGVWGDYSGLPTLAPVANTIYLKPSANWLEADAHFAAWVWKGTGAGKVYNFKQNARVPALYEITVPAGSTGMILFRLGPSQKYNDGSTTFPSSSWAKSGDLTIGSNNLYTVVNWLESSSKFSKITSLY